VDHLRERYGLTVPAIVDKVREALNGSAADSSNKIASLA